MKRMWTILMGKVGASLMATVLLGLFLGLSIVYAGNFGAAGELTLAGNEDQSTCYAWDAPNLTGEDADSLQIELSGIPTVTQVYTGDANPLGDAAAGSGYDAANDRYTLVLGPNGSVVGAAEAMHVGVCVPQPFSAAHFTWSAGGNDIAPTMLLPDLEWTWEGSDAVQVTLTNTTGVTLTLLALQALDPGEPLALDALDATVADQLPLAAVMQDDPVAMAPGAVHSAIVGLDAIPSGDVHTLVLATQWSVEDDLSVVNTLLAQTTGPADNRLYLPAVLR